LIEFVESQLEPLSAVVFEVCDGVDRWQQKSRPLAGFFIARDGLTSWLVLQEQEQLERSQQVRKQQRMQQEQKRQQNRQVRKQQQMQQQKQLERMQQEQKLLQNRKLQEQVSYRKRSVPKPSGLRSTESFSYVILLN
jgi:hypothetical protein